MPIDPTRKGKYRIVRPDGTELEAQHNYIEEAYGVVSNQPDGTYQVLPPWTEVTKTSDPPGEPPVEEPPEEGPPVDPDPPAPPTGDNPFNALYSAGFKLSALSADPVPDVPRPARATGVAGPHLVDPAYGTRVYRVTDVAEAVRGRMRHDYSRRQAFNADNSYYLAFDDDGACHLYEAATFKRLKSIPPGLPNAEPLWHPTDPKILRFTEAGGGAQWYAYNVDTGARTVEFDLAGKTPWSDATRFWTKAEGSFDAAGRYICLMAQNSDYVQLGLVCYDSVDQRVVGTLSSTKGLDHCSMSASGRWCVPSGSQTVAYSRDFSKSVVLHDDSAHSDLGLLPNGNDAYVYVDYKTGSPNEGWLMSCEIDASGAITQTRLHNMYVNGGASTLHISAKCFDRPGWAVISTYDDYSNYGTYPAQPIQPIYRKVSLFELKPGGRKLNVAHIHAKNGKGSAYFHEPQATISRDGSMILFSSSWDDATRYAEDYLVGLPDSVYD